MGELVELEDADFAAQMQDLINEAQQARGVAAPAPEALPEDTTVVAFRPELVQETPKSPAVTPAVVKAPAKGGDKGLVELLKPLMMGIQAVSRATGEQAQAMVRLEKAVAPQADAKRDLPGVVEELKTLVEQRNGVSRQMFDALHAELKDYKDSFLLETVHRPLIRDLITQHDDLEKVHQQMYDAVAAVDEFGQEGVANPALLRLRLRLESARLHVEHNVEFLLEVLARMEVQRLPVSYGKLDKQTQRAVAVEPTDEQAQDLDLVRTVKRGFMWKERLFRPEEVVIRKWKNSTATA